MRCVYLDQNIQGKRIHVVSKQDTPRNFDPNFSFLVRGSDIDQELYPIVLAEETPEKVRFTFIAMKIFFSTHILTDGFVFI